MKYIQAIGIELEGAWPIEQTPKYAVKDVSVQFTDLSSKSYFIGEIASRPLAGLADAQNWIIANIPRKVNYTCGLHVHISLHNLSDYIRLMDKEFNTYFLDEMYKFGQRMGYPSDHQFWCRLKGSSPFCAKDFKPEEQVIRTDKRGPRYAQINFCHSLHGTVECRLFSGTNSITEAYECTAAWINCVESFLDKSEVKNKEFDKTFKICEAELMEIAKKIPIKIRNKKAKIQLTTEPQALADEYEEYLPNFREFISQ